MNSLKSSCSAFSGCTAAVLLAGCIASQSPIASPPQPNAAPKLRASSGTLLYVVNYENAAFFAFPQGKQIGELAGIGHPENVCPDTLGNVWFTSNIGAQKYRLYKFAHGGTKPIATIDVPASKTAVACAINPINGDLAVLSSYGSSHGSVLIWAGARSGTPSEYNVYFFPTACAYDERGNLLVTGWADSDGYYFAELKSGAASFTSISVKPHSFFVGGVRWDGDYFAVAMVHGGGSRIYRVQVSGSTGKVVQMIHPHPLSLETWFAVEGDTLVATERSHDDEQLGVWKYPETGTPVKSFPGLTHPQGLALSTE